MNRKLQAYREEVVPFLMEKFGKKNAFGVAKLEKITLNVGIGRESAARDKVVAAVTEQLTAMTGQKPRTNPIRLSIAGFKVRQGEIVGLSVTLRGDRMWSFFDKFVSIVLPQVKDFTGVSRSAFDGKGNYSLGLREQIIFPEIKYDEIDRVRGLQVGFAISNSSGKEESLALLEKLGMPFTKTE
jgi:large subunit ribosomal protein L5